MMNTPPPNPRQNNSLSPDQNNPQPHYSPEASNRSSLYLAAFILLILNCVGVGLYGIWVIINYVALRNSLGDINEVTVVFIVWSDMIFLIVGIVLVLALAWLIPMTVLCYRYYKQVGTAKEQGHLAFAICTLIFCNLISGILLLVASSSFNSNPRYPNQM